MYIINDKFFDFSVIFHKKIDNFFSQIVIFYIQLKVSYLLIRNKILFWIILTKNSYDSTGRKYTYFFL
jgi:hypothetical protein